MSLNFMTYRNIITTANKISNYINQTSIYLWKAYKNTVTITTNQSICKVLNFWYFGYNINAITITITIPW